MLPLVEWRHRVLVLREWAPSLPVLSKLPDHVFVINSKIFWCGRLGELGELAVISGGRRLALLCSAATHPPPEVSTTNYYIMFGFFVFIALNSLHSLEPSIPSTVRLTSDPTFRSLLSPPFRPRSSSLFRSVPPYIIQSPVFALSFFPLLYIAYIRALFFFTDFFSPVPYLFATVFFSFASFEEKGKLIRQTITSYGVPVASTLP